MSDFSIRLREFRARAGLSQQLADKLYIKQQSYYAYEHGSASPNPEMLAKIAHELKVSVNELLGCEEKTPMNF